MKKLFLLAAGAFLLQSSVSAQTGSDAQEAIYQPKSHFEIGIGGIARVDFKRAGVSGNIKWVLPTHDEEGSGFVITGKATHLPADNGAGFFSAFGMDKTANNISTLYLMVGYRQYLLDHHKPNTNLFFEFNLGLAQVGIRKPTANTGVAINPLFGLQFSKHFAATIGVQALIVKRYAHVAEIGLSYRF